MTDLAPITDHYQRAYDHLLEIYRSKPRFNALLASYLRQVQDLEDAVWDSIEARFLDSCDLVRLKVLGRIVGQVYRGELLEDYRTAVRVRIKINRSNGKSAELIEIALLLLESATVALDEYYPASIVLHVTSVFPAGVDPHLVVELMREAKAAGVGFGMLFKRSAAFKYSSNPSAPGSPTSVGYGSTITPGLGGKYSSVY